MTTARKVFLKKAFLNIMREQIRTLLLQSKILQMFANVFALFGVVLFGYIYFIKTSDQNWEITRDPLFVLNLLLPFIPAACFAYAASKKREKIKSLIESLSEPKEADGVVPQK